MRYTDLSSEELNCETDGKAHSAADAGCASAKAALLPSAKGKNKMYNCRLIFKRKPDTDELSEDAIADMIDDYCGVLRMNGQIICGCDIYRDGETYVAATVLPETDSLSDMYSSVYVRERRAALERYFDVVAAQDGHNIEYSDSCRCAKPAYYRLSAEGIDESPLICGDCGKPVPLYRVPRMRGEDDMYELICWRDAAVAMRKLWFYGLWDKFTYGETTRCRSKLNRKGRELRGKLEKALRVPVFYFIWRASADFADEYLPLGLPVGAPETCPLCGNSLTAVHGMLRCEKCRLEFEENRAE